MAGTRKVVAGKTAPRKVRPHAYVAMNCLLLTRAEGTPQNGDPLPQEDVNAYLEALRDQLEANVPLPPERTRLLSRYDIAAWRRLAEEAVGEETCHLDLVHRAASREDAIAVVRKLRVDQPGHGIDQDHAGTGVEREGPIINGATPDISEVRHAADVEQHPGTLGGAEEQHIGCRHQRGPLPPSCDIA